MSKLQLYLVNNDPSATVLMSPSGQPLYAIRTRKASTSSSKSSTSTSGSSSPGSQLSLLDTLEQTGTTTIYRLDNLSPSRGQVETEVGIITPHALHKGASAISLCLEGDYHIDIGTQRVQVVEEGKSECLTPVTDSEPDVRALEVHENSWAFVGPDSRKYVWQMFVQSPILVLADSTMMPLARYRRAKLGIVSRSRKASLEIMPEGLAVMDMIVVTFVAFMKYRVPAELHSLQMLANETTRHHSFFSGETVHEAEAEPPVLKAVPAQASS
ncbi:hypothetical protein CC1G_10396 [Coprinopsis cinerea okayama7|uniref:DUF6593 domain-containing protein n=1 Tax=Coprinopsis cinerea (strain Okayama-7 / 130 / ATCC MYA-4618 / FGSC 9003) TaxID=240176 RepID=A8PAM5_COPC7|nr:hypothetical protein CC1G_10396 [Coprinopsis cinerea okayama7\|eukprot:XP_001840012.1 hypothetical protein CC1G_10396 [Coprinopsis cinerea okayama7\